MRENIVAMSNGQSIRMITVNTAVVGSGAAGLNAACMVDEKGQKDVMIFTESLNAGTSRNTGSDKQTYYKLALSGDTDDSPYAMARAIYSGLAMEGDIALVEAANSAKCFYRLCDLGVPFPYNKYGEYVGYQTDHDIMPRGTSAGPLTSKMMVESLIKDVKARGIQVMENCQLVKILLNDDGESIGFLAIDRLAQYKDDRRFILVNCVNIIYATGGPAGLYESSVYPVSQIGTTGAALEAGVLGKNLLEWQYGIASIKFRWNLSGSYQQVLPRYISTDQDGNDEQDFLKGAFKSSGKLLDAIFLKGYQWPFDVKKVRDEGSSLIDILVHREIAVKGRRVFLDFNRNPEQLLTDGKIDFSILGREAEEYLEKSSSMQGTPLERLFALNKPAYDLYLDNGIDLAKENLEIAVCAQHNNGGLYGNCWWESNINHFFPVGEVNGTHGISRPGGSALNSGQVGGLRAAEYITRNYTESTLSNEDFIQMTEKQIGPFLELADQLINSADKSNILYNRHKIQSRMSKYAAAIRQRDELEKAYQETCKDLAEFAEKTTISEPEELSAAFQNRDLLITQKTYLYSMLDYIYRGGKSRGSFLVEDEYGKYEISGLKFSIFNETNPAIQVTSYTDNETLCNYHQPNQIPEKDGWFEKVWSEYRNLSN